MPMRPSLFNNSIWKVVAAAPTGAMAPVDVKLDGAVLDGNDDEEGPPGGPIVVDGTLCIVGAGCC